MRTVQKILHSAEEAIEFINNEEALYKWELTCYPELEAIKEDVEPYQALFGLVQKWQRSEKRFLSSFSKDSKFSTTSIYFVLRARCRT